MTHYTEEEKMQEQTTGQHIEEKQDILKEIDPEREERLSGSFVETAAYLFATGGDDKEVKRAEELYEQALDDAIADETRALLELWDSTEKAYQETLYPYLKPAAKAAIDRREEGR